MKQNMIEVKMLKSKPVLMCPDDCDLLCTLIVAEVIKENDKVYWRRIGIDISNKSEFNGGYECIGSKVEWLESVPQMSFDLTVYNAQINKLYE